MKQQTAQNSDIGREAMERRVQFVDEKLAEFRAAYPFEVPTTEEMKQWINEAMRTAGERGK